MRIRKGKETKNRGGGDTGLHLVPYGIAVAMAVTGERGHRESKAKSLLVLHCNKCATFGRPRVQGILFS